MFDMASSLALHTSSGSRPMRASRDSRFSSGETDSEGPPRIGANPKRIPKLWF